jgi:hypothetical protein
VWQLRHRDITVNPESAFLREIGGAAAGGGHSLLVRASAAPPEEDEHTDFGLVTLKLYAMPGTEIEPRLVGAATGQTNGPR